jgi:signal transduction histidine kinase
MIKIVTISLENEMDLVLAHKRSIKVAEKLGLTVATQTTFATAVSEIARTIIEHTDDGQLEIGLEQNKQRYSLVAAVFYDPDVNFTNADSGFYYAQKLVPEFSLKNGPASNQIEMKIGLARSLRLDPVKIANLKQFFEEAPPLNAYEEIKRRNLDLHKLTAEQEEEIRQSKIINDQKTEFISIASHEIKTPVTILKAYTQMAKALKEPVSARLTELLNKIDLQSTKLNSLVQQLLDIAKIENGSLQYNKQFIKINAFIQEQISIMTHILPHHQITANLADDADVFIDKLRMEQVFSNLFGNAAKYSQLNTQITISSDLHEDGVTLSVTDQGMGMRPDTIKSVFEKFYRARDVVKSHSGLGMGLYITSKIITDHGGKIWVESEQGIGSTFFFTIPFRSL